MCASYRYTIIERISGSESSTPTTMDLLKVLGGRHDLYVRERVSPNSGRRMLYDAAVVIMFVETADNPGHRLLCPSLQLDLRQRSQLLKHHYTAIEFGSLMELHRRDDSSHCSPLRTIDRDKYRFRHSNQRGPSNDTISARKLQREPDLFSI